MVRYALGRLVQAVVVIWGVSLFVFVLTYLSGDPTSLLLPPNASVEERARFREQMGFDRPLIVQFYVFKNVHWPMFEELHEYVQTCRDIGEIVICLPDLPQIIGTQNYALVEKLLSLKATVVARPRTDADVTFIADTIAGKVQGCGKIVNIGHGTISNISHKTIVLDPKFYSSFPVQQRIYLH